jgi:hypothetical protein
MALRAPLIFAVAIAIAVIAPARVSAWEPPASAAAALGRGGTVIEVTGEPGGVGLIHGAIDIAAPPQLVWQVMTDCRETPKLITSAAPCKVLSADPAGAWDVREQLTHGAWPIPDIRNVYRSDYQPFSLIRFRRVAGDLKVEEGEWRLEPLAGGRATRVIYVNRLAANILAPALLVREGLRRDTPKVLINLRRECLARGGVR